MDEQEGDGCPRTGNGFMAGSLPISGAIVCLDSLGSFINFGRTTCAPRNGA